MDASSGRRHLRILRLRLDILARWRPGARGRLLFMALVTGIAAALVAELFKEASGFIQYLLTGVRATHVASFEAMPLWRRLLVPTLGGFLAGTVLLLGKRMGERRSTSYMEAVTLGSGIVPVRMSLLRSFSSVFSIASGEAIGREGPLAQLSAMAGSIVGRLRREPPARLRLMVACGAAGGLAAAYSAPIAGALFVAEIIIGSISMETLAPLLVSSISSAFTVRMIEGEGSLYPVDFGASPGVTATVFFLAVGLVCGLCAPVFVTILKAGRRLFSRMPDLPPVNLALGGLLVGLAAMSHPEVVGNGQSVIRGMLQGGADWQGVLVLLLLKVAIVAAVFGSGAVGGVFTPSLLVGASLGYLCGSAAQALGVAEVSPVTSAVVGMGAFLCAVTQAPAMAVLMLFEMTMSPGALVPLVAASAAAYAAVKALRADSLYRETLTSGPKSVFDRDMGEIRVADLLRPQFAKIGARSDFSEIAGRFLAEGEPMLPVADAEGRYLGAVLLSDVRAYLREGDLAGSVIARDILHEEVAPIPADADLAGAMRAVSGDDRDSLPVVDGSGRLAGMLGRADLFLVISELTRRRGHGIAQA